MYMLCVCLVELISELDITIHTGEAGLHSVLTGPNMSESEEQDRRKITRARGISFLSFASDGNCQKNGKCSEVYTM